MADSILVLNAGSSSVKFSVFRVDDVSVVHEGQVSGIGGGAKLHVLGSDTRNVPGGDHHAALRAIEDWLGRQGGGVVVAVGHRVVHGGERFDRPVRIESDVLEALEALVPLAPLHQPHALEAVRAAQHLYPGLPQVACFDTAFHHASPRLSQLFALPRALTESGLRRYGFHGLSYEFIAGRLPQVAPTIGSRVVVAHLGSGASLCAMRDGRSQATTMGLSALDGLVMGTRCGLLDAGVVLYLAQQGHSAGAIQTLLYEKSGLLGVSGESADMQVLLRSGSSAAKEAVDLFVYRLGRELGSMAAALGGLDGLVFTGGIGENAAEIRARVCHEAAWLGFTLDPAANAENGPLISTRTAAATAWVIPTDENLAIARHTKALIAA